MSTLLEKLIGSAALKDNPLKCLCIKLKPGSVTTDKIADKAVTPAKLSDSVKTDLIQNPINAVRENLQLSISEVQENLGNHVSDTTKHITAQERSTWNSKQDALTFDNLPTANSDNPVKSKGIKKAIDDVQNVIDSRIIYNELDFKKAIVADGHNVIAVKAHSAAGKTDGNVEITAENLIIKNTKNAHLKLASGSDILFGGIGSITSTTDMTIQAGKDGVSTGDLNLNGTNVKINGTNINTIKNNAQNALNKINAMYPDEGKGMRIETSGIYYAYPDLGNPDLIPSSMSHGMLDGYLLLVTIVEELDVHGGYRHLHQLIIDIVTGRKATRYINYPHDSTIDWSTAPNFTEV